MIAVTFNNLINEYFNYLFVICDMSIYKVRIVKFVEFLTPLPKIYTSQHLKKKKTLIKTKKFYFFIDSESNKDLLAPNHKIHNFPFF